LDYDILEARYIRDRIVWLRFRDGTVGEVDLTAELEGPILRQLRDPEFFRQLRVDPELHTLVWPNGADVAPERLHSVAADQAL